MAKTAGALRPISEVWEWQIVGRCRDRSGAQFFHPDDDLGRISRRLREAAAKRICEGCPVLSECATHALTGGGGYGVWGGLRENERLLLQDVGWRDAIDHRGRLNVVRLQRRVAAAKAKVRRERQQRLAKAGWAGG